MAGHADSQGIKGAGTAGEAVDIKGKMPMDSSMSDELFWNLKIRDAIVQVGKERGLNINAYAPGVRNIVDGNDPLTNWSAGARHVRQGGYAIEIHFDSYGEYGFAQVKIEKSNDLFYQVPQKTKVWMSHMDTVDKIPEDWIVTSHSSNGVIASLQNKNKTRI